MTTGLTDLHTDALKELFNIGIGKAAALLSEMVAQEVQLAVPMLVLDHRLEHIANRVDPNAQQVSAIRQTFEGAFRGSAMLVYPRSDSLALVRSLAGEETALEYLMDFEQESLLEVGNIILNGCLWAILTLMELKFRFQFPEYLRGDCRRLLALPLPGDDAGPCQYLAVHFSSGQETHERLAIRGAVVLTLPDGSFDCLITHLNRMLDLPTA
ncbi:MAG: hypothetical protein H7831_11345 [Magnetococcus sp. WYHC-3]